MLVFSNHHPEKKQGSLVNTKQLDTRQIETTLKIRSAMQQHTENCWHRLKPKRHEFQYSLLILSLEMKGLCEL